MPRRQRPPRACTLCPSCGSREPKRWRAGPGAEGRDLLCVACAPNGQVRKATPIAPAPRVAVPATTPSAPPLAIPTQSAVLPLDQRRSFARTQRPLHGPPPLALPLEGGFTENFSCTRCRTQGRKTRRWEDGRGSEWLCRECYPREGGVGKVVVERYVVEDGEGVRFERRGSCARCVERGDRTERFTAALMVLGRFEMLCRKCYPLEKQGKGGVQVDEDEEGAEKAATEDADVEKEEEEEATGGRVNAERVAGEEGTAENATKEERMEEEVTVKASADERVISEKVVTKDDNPKEENEAEGDEQETNIAIEEENEINGPEKGGVQNGIICIKCSTHVLKNWRTGPDGPRTLCKDCGGEYGSLSLPLYKRKDGKVTVIYETGVRRVKHVGFLMKGTKRNFLRPRVEELNKNGTNVEGQRKVLAEVEIIDADAESSDAGDAQKEAKEDSPKQTEEKNDEAQIEVIRVSSGSSYKGSSLENPLRSNSDGKGSSANTMVGNDSNEKKKVSKPLAMMSLDAVMNEVSPNEPESSPSKADCSSGSAPERATLAKIEQADASQRAATATADQKPSAPATPSGIRNVEEAQNDAQESVLEEPQQTAKEIPQAPHTQVTRKRPRSAQDGDGDESRASPRREAPALRRQVKEKGSRSHTQQANASGRESTCNLRDEADSDHGVDKTMEKASVMELRHPPVFVKASFESENVTCHRRFPLSRKLSFAMLRDRLANLFETSGPFAISYMDNENDFVRVSSDVEVDELYRIVSTHNISPVRIRLDVVNTHR